MIRQHNNKSAFKKICEQLLSCVI